LPANVSLPMPSSRPRWLASVIGEHLGARLAARPVESCPPSAHWPHQAWSSRIGRWIGASAWFVATSESLPALGHRQRSAALASARLDFAEALFDVRTPAAGLLLDRIAIIRSLHELWHLRGDVFGHVARRHGQAEANARMASLDAHFPKRMRRAGFASQAPVIGDQATGALRPHRRTANG
jgi:hypothetical protein